MKKTWNIANKNIFKYNTYSHWIDYLSYWILNKNILKDFFTNRLYNLDTDNSNFWAIQFLDEVFSITKLSISNWTWYIYSVVYNWISISIFEITEYSQRHSEFCNNQFWVVHFYGAYFRLIELWHFSSWFIEKINNIFSLCPISRLDYRFDFIDNKKVNKIPEPWLVLPNIRKNKKIRKYYSWINTLQSWSVWNKLNKTIFIRLYNKLDELKWNLKKTYLYWDFDKFKSYIRLEYEFGYKWCAWYLWQDILKLIDKAFWTSWIEVSSFKWNLYKPQIALNLSDQIDKLRYIKMFKSMAKNLKNNWIDPILIIEKIWL